MKKLGAFIFLLGIAGLFFSINKVPANTEEVNIFLFKIFNLPIKADYLVGISILLVLIGISVYCKKTKRRSYPY